LVAASEDEKRGLVFYRNHKGIFVIHQVKDKPLVLKQNILHYTSRRQV